MNAKDYRRKRDEKIVEFIGDRWMLTIEIAKLLETDCNSTNEILKSMVKRGLLESKLKMLNRRRIWRIKGKDATP